MRLTTRQRRLLQWVGYPLLALVVFVFALAYTFPYSRLKDKIMEGLNQKYDVNIASIEPTLIPGTFVINKLMLRTRPKDDKEKPVTMVIDRIEINVGVLSAMFWTVDMAQVGVDIDAKIGGGNLDIHVSHEKGTQTLSVTADTKMLPVGGLPGVREAVGLPMTGGLTASLSLTLPQGKWSRADGQIKMNCVNCTIGDGVAKMKMKPPPPKKGRNGKVRRAGKPIFKEGVTVPKLRLGAVIGDIEIKKGKGVVKALRAKSDDGFMEITGTIDFKDPFKESVMPGCMKFGFSEELKARVPKVVAMTAGVHERNRQADGSFAIPTKGKLVDLRFNPKKQCVGLNTAEKAIPKISAEVEPAKVPDRGVSTAPDPAKIDDPKLEKLTAPATGPALSEGQGDKPAEKRDNDTEASENGGRDEDEAGEDEGEEEEDEGEESGDDEEDDEGEEGEDEGEESDDDEEEEGPVID